MHDPLVSFEEDDPQLAEAIATARKTMPIFFEFFAEPKPNQRSFLLKVRFEAYDESEHIWLADLDLGTDPPVGTVANEPRLPSLRFMQQTEFDPASVTDWMFVEDGYLVGGFTIKLIRSRMSDRERAAHDAQAPYKFNS